MKIQIDIQNRTTGFTYRISFQRSVLDCVHWLNHGYLSQNSNPTAGGFQKNDKALKNI